MVKHIYVSPHADDAALSCGGRILAGGSRDDHLVLNVFTSEDADAVQDPKSDGAAFSDSISMDRDREDRSAWESVGIETIHARLPEALLRKKFPFAILPRKTESAVVDRLMSVLREQATTYPDAAFHFPAGFGSHIDHLLCRAAGFRLLDEGIVDRILLYEDTPYSWLKFVRRPHYAALLRRVAIDPAGRALAARSDGLGLASYLRHACVPFPRGRKLFPLVAASLTIGNTLPSSSRGPKSYAGTIRRIELDGATMRRKRDLIAHYASQIPMLFGDQPDDMLRDYSDLFRHEYAMEIRPSAKAQPG